MNIVYPVSSVGWSFKINVSGNNGNWQLATSKKTMPGNKQFSTTNNVTCNKKEDLVKPFQDQLYYMYILEYFCTRALRIKDFFLQKREHLPQCQAFCCWLA